MKRLFIPCLLLLVFTSGCALLQAKTEVSENTFYCSYPQTHLRFDPRFKYIGEMEVAGQGRTMRQFKQVNFIEKNYFFVDSEGSKVNRVIFINVSRIQGIDVEFVRKSNPPSGCRETGVIKLGGDKYQYCTGSPFSHEPQIAYIKKQGYDINPGSSKYFNRLPGGSAKSSLTIVCLQGSTQAGHLEEFYKDCEKSFEVLQ